MSNFGHAKSAIKKFHLISTFSFLGGGYVKLWSCQICCKKISADFQLFICWEGGGWVGTLNFGHAKSAIKNFHSISNFSLLGRGGVRVRGVYIKLWSCQICHKIFFGRFPTFHSWWGWGGGLHLQVDW